jgi:hypothetical protein
VFQVSLVRRASLRILKRHQRSTEAIGFLVSFPIARLGGDGGLVWSPSSPPLGSRDAETLRDEMHRTLGSRWKRIDLDPNDPDADEG